MWKSVLKSCSFLGVKSVEVCPKAGQQLCSSRCASFFLMLQSCRSSQLVLVLVLVPVPVLVLSAAAQPVKCWRTASSILFNAHCYFVTVRQRGGACPSKKWLKHLEGGESAEGRRWGARRGTGLSVKCCVHVLFDPCPIKIRQGEGNRYIDLLSKRSFTLKLILI